MTEAMKAHLRLLERTPRERIRTHEQAPEGHKGLKPPAEVTERRRRWIRANLGNFTKKQMAVELGISLGSLNRNFIAMGIPCKKSKRGRPRKDNKNG